MTKSEGWRKKWSPFGRYERKLASRENWRMTYQRLSTYWWLRLWNFTGFAISCEKNSLTLGAAQPRPCTEAGPRRIYHDMPNKFKAGWFKFISRRVYDIIITGKESCIYRYGPETKNQWTLRVFQNDPTPTRVNWSRSAGNILIASFISVTWYLVSISLLNQSNDSWCTTRYLYLCLGWSSERRECFRFWASSSSSI